MEVIKKQCSKCKVSKELKHFHKQKTGKLGRRADCRICRGCPPFKSIEEKAIKRQEYLKKWKQNNKEKIRIYAREHAKYCRRTNLEYKLKQNLRQRINKAIKQNRRPGSSVKDLGCTIGEFRVYLESKFQPGMTWGNYGRTGWHIDHVKPLANFDLTNPKEFKKACHYTNLQPLWAEDNLRKNKY